MTQVSVPLTAATILVSTLFNAPVKFRRPNQMRLAGPILDKLIAQPSAIALIEGPSGSGKSTLLRRISSLAARAGLVVIPTLKRDARSRIRVIDHLCALLAGNIEAIGPSIVKAAIELLTVCGLGEPGIWLRTARVLSDSEQDRFTIACALARAGEAESKQQLFIIVIDELLSTLDRITAQATARSLSRLAKSRPFMRILAATAHMDLASFLEPAVVVRRTGGAQ